MFYGDAAHFRQLVKLYILCYVVYRFLTEYIRPEARLWYGLTGYQAACVVIFGLFVWLWRRESVDLSKSPSPVPEG